MSKVSVTSGRKIRIDELGTCAKDLRRLQRGMFL